MRCLLDTTAYAAFKRGHRGVHRTLQRASEIVLSPVVLGELRAALRAAPHRQLEELEEFISSPRVAVIALDEGTSERYALIQESLRRAGTSVPSNDLWIAASAMQHGLRVVTTDARYARVRQIVLDLHPP